MESLSSSHALTLARLARLSRSRSQDLYVDCIRRIEVYSAAKVFVMDNLFYEVTSADDGICGPMPGAGNDLMPPSAPGEGSAASSAHAAPSWALTLGGAVATAAIMMLRRR